MNNQFIQKQLLFLINKFLKKYKYTNLEIRNYLINCLNIHGYIIETDATLSEYDTLFQDFEQSFQEPQRPQRQQVYQEPQEFVQGINESNSVDLYGFNRTFINPEADTSKRLLEIQKRGITPEEMDFLKVSNLIESALTRIDTDKMVKNVALNIYLTITKYYLIPKNVRVVKGENKGSVKLGYILLSLYYALIHNHIYLSRNVLVTYFSDINLSDLPKADQNIKIIFENIPGYEFIYKGIQEQCLCNMYTFIKNNYPDKLILIKKVIKDLQNAGLFNTPALTVQVAASIYYNKIVKLKDISCDVSDDTIGKTVKIIKNYYKS